MKKTVSIIISLAAALLLSAAPARALPQGGSVVSGSSTISRPDSQTLYVRQTTDKSIINWQGYSIGANEKVNYFQPGSSSISLNRVVGQDPSRIYGQLHANGQVWVINPNGLLVGNGATINTGSFLGSTLNISDDDFLTSRYKKFHQTGPLASIVNQGSITSQEGGYVVLISPSIVNDGSVRSYKGKSYLGTGSEVTLNFAGNDLIGLSVDKEAAEEALGIVNKGTISANGGEVIVSAKVVVSAKVASDLIKTVINNEGFIEAKTIEERNGEILLLGGMEHNAVEVSGKLDASAPNGGNGGFIETSAAKVRVKDGAVITTAAPYGKTGTWLIDPKDFTIAATGGDMTGAQLSANLITTDATILSSDGGTEGSGDINVNANVAWNSNLLTLTAARDINVNAIMEASGSARLTMNTATTVAGGTVKVGFAPGQANGFAGRVDFPGRSGTGFLTINGNGYTVINDVAGLQGISGNLTGYYALGNNIDASGTSTWNWNAGKVRFDGFAPLTVFNGVFDGLGHTIDRLYINRPGTSYIGLFGQTGAASVIRNIGMTNSNITGSDKLGGLVGYNVGSISNSYNAGTVNGAGSFFCGGLVGKSDNANISNSYNAGLVNAPLTEDVGGLIGETIAGSISNCYNTGAVKGRGLLGGLMGEAYGTNINNSYNTGTVTGGIGGGAYDGNKVGGLVGLYRFYSTPYPDPDVFGTINNCYNTGAVYGTGTQIGGLVGMNYYNNIRQSYNTGNVTGIGDKIGGIVGDNNSSLSNVHNTGVVTGANSVGGIVGFSYPDNDGTIDNVYNTGAVTGNNNVGGLIGENYSAIANSYNTGAINGVSVVGGLAGINGNDGLDTATLTNSYSTGAVTGNDSVGGLAGINESAIGNSYSTGAVSGVTTVGGLVGINEKSGTRISTITNSYSTGAVTGNDFVGGLAGENKGAIGNSYSAGSVLGTTNVGGLVGTNSGDVTAAFWDIQTSGQIASAGGTGKTTTEMKQSATFAAAGWDIDDVGGTGKVWRVYDGNTYPLLRRFLSPLTAAASNVTKVYDGLPYTGNMTVTYTPSNYETGKVLGTPSYGNATAVGTYAIPAGIYSEQQGYDITTTGLLTITERVSSWTLSGLGDVEKPVFFFPTEPPFMMEKQAMIIQGHELRTLLYREALDELRKNPEAADVPLCKPDKPDSETLCLRDPDTQPAPQTQKAPQKRRLAVLIGNNDYQAPIPPLKTPISDIEKIASLLRDKYGYETKILQNAGKAQIIEALNKVGEEAGPEDSVFLFYAGHGYLMDDTKKGYWIPVDGSTKTAANWISNNDIAKLLQGISARQVILLSDSCYSGALTKEQKLQSSSGARKKDLLRLRSVMAFSSGDEEPVTDEGKEGHSIFAWNLMKTLDKVQETALGYDIYNDVSAGVRLDYPQTPQYGALVTAGHMEGGEFVFDAGKSGKER